VRAGGDKPPWQPFTGDLVSGKLSMNPDQVTSMAAN
jgi:hypothetical protein